MERLVTDEKTQRYLDEIGEEYKDFILEEVVKNSEDFDDISIGDILRIDNDVKQYILNKNLNRRRRNLFKIGSIYILFACFMYIFSETFFQIQNISYLDSFQLCKLMALIIMLVGALAVWLSYFVPSRGLRKDNKKNVDENKKMVEYEVIATWRKFEVISNNLVDKSNIIVGNSLIQCLKRENIITEEDEQELLDFLRIRNNIVHEENSSIDYKKANADIKSIKQIIDKIKKLYF